MGQNLIKFFQDIADLIQIGGIVPFVLFLICLIIIFALGYAACRMNLSGKGPDHWSNKGDVHNWTPEDS